MEVRNDLPADMPNGKYGIEASTKAVLAANNIYDLGAVTYLDDKEWKQDDWVDLISKGPGTIQSVITAANSFDELDEELLDLSEAEKSALVALAGNRIKKPGYAKILKGIFELIDGVAELKNPDNPVG